MTDRTLPFNQLPPLPPKANLDDIQILKKVITANKAISQLNGLIRSLENAEIVLEPLKVKEAVESSGIENISTTVSEALQAELFSAEKLSPEQKETKNYKQALLFGFNQVKKRRFLTTNDLIEIQTQLGLQPGIRNLPGTKMGNPQTGNVYYTPPTGERLLKSLLKNFEAYYNDESSDPDYLVKLAVLHYQFEAIHPFFDGNGRTGRILMVLYLVAHSCLVSPTLFISRYINQNRNEYYRLLREVTFEDNWKEWILFILDAVETQATETNSTILRILELREWFKNEVLSKFNFTYSQELLSYVFSNAFYTQNKLMESTQIRSNKTALEYMNALEDEGILKTTESKTKEKVYYFDKLLKLLE